ncbi:MAG TPA: hypothetical protein VFX89_13700 [Gammaproteobacteria bacterium]|nr:hypothetical protein [Gammaproteobacteria bacterium]
MTRLAVVIALLSMAASAEAYVGPGMGLGVIGAIFGLLAAVLLALAGMIWYPMKRLVRARRGVARTSADPAVRHRSSEPPPR